jgi:dTDP-4-amino-4,6-dideoxygalactose transaminase
LVNEGVEKDKSNQLNLIGQNMSKSIIKPIPFFTPDIGEHEIEAVTRVLKSGRLVYGPEVEAFEAEFSGYLQIATETAVSVSSATAGLHLCLAAMGIGPGDEVIVPTLTFSATAEVVERVGAIPIFVDIDLETFCISIEDTKNKITDSTKVIIPVHHSGRACKMYELHKIANDKNIAVIEDAAHALPSTYNGSKIGTLLSNATVFSFYANKTMTTGDGGMIITAHHDLANFCRRLRTHGIRPATKEEISNGILYDIETSGYKYNLTELGAAIGRIQLRKIDSMANQRRAHVERYCQNLISLPLILPDVSEDKNSHAWHLFIVRFVGGDARALRNKAISIFQQEHIGFSIHYRPLHQHSHWRKIIPSKQTFPMADTFYDSALSLPLYPGMTDENIDRVCAALAKVFQ